MVWQTEFAKTRFQYFDAILRRLGLFVARIASNDDDRLPTISLAEVSIRPHFMDRTRLLAYAM
jgi:hypothetical protein